MMQVWDSDEPTFNAIRRELGVKILKAKLIIEIGVIVLELKADLDKIQIADFANYIIELYPSYTISDLTCFKNFFLTSKNAKSWGKPILQNLTDELNNYSVQRQEYAVGQRQREHIEADEILRQNKVILDTYAKMKAKANEPVITDKQRGIDAHRVNDEKIEQLRKEYHGGCMQCGGGAWDSKKPCTCQVSHQK